MKKKAKTADIKFRKQSNAMERTSEKAPYLGKVELKGTVYEDAFIDEMYRYSRQVYLEQD